MESSANGASPPGDSFDLKDALRLRLRHSLSPSSRSPPPQSGRTRKKKRGKRIMRRHTLSGSAAAENHQNHHRGKEWLASEREKFLELLRVRHPSQAAAVENELEWQSGRSNGGPNRRDVMYLQFNGETRRVAIPPNLTMKSLRALFSDAFAHSLSPAQLEPPAGTIYIQDPTSALFYQLVDARDVYDRAILTVHLFNPRASLATTPPRNGGVARGSGRWPPNKASSLAFHADSDLSVEKLERMQEQLSHLTGLVHRAVQSKGKTVEDGGDASLSSSSASVAMGTEYPPPKPRRLYLDNENNGRPSPPPADPPMKSKGGVSAARKEWAYRALSVEEKDLVVKSADGLVRNIRHLKTELHALRRQHRSQCQSFAGMLKDCKEKIARAISAREPKRILVSSETRGDLISEEGDVEKTNEKLFDEIFELDAAVEEIRVDVVKRHCRVDVNELNSLLTEVKRVGKILTEGKKTFDALQDRIKPIMTSELEVIVKEEKFLKEQGESLEENLGKCKRMQGALTALKKFGSVQQYRDTTVPIITPIVQDLKLADLFENIIALAPNHIARAESVKIAEHSYALRKQLRASRKEQQVANLLDTGRKRLKPVRRVLEQLESRRDDLVRQMYVEDQQEVRYERGPPLPSVPRYHHNGYTGDDEMGYTGRRDRGGGGGGSKKNRDYFYHRLRYPATKGHSASPPVQGVARAREYDYYPPDVRHTKSANWMRSGSARDGSRDVSEFYSRSGPSLSHERQSPLSPPSRNGGGAAGGARDLARQAQFQRKARAQSVKLNRGGKRKEMNLDLVTTDL